MNKLLYIPLALVTFLPIYTINGMESPTPDDLGEYFEKLWDASSEWERLNIKTQRRLFLEALRAKTQPIKIITDDEKDCWELQRNDIKSIDSLESIVSEQERGIVAPAPVPLSPSITAQDFNTLLQFLQNRETIFAHYAHDEKLGGFFAQHDFNNLLQILTNQELFALLKTTQHLEQSALEQAAFDMLLKRLIQKYYTNQRYIGYNTSFNLGNGDTLPDQQMRYRLTQNMFAQFGNIAHRICNRFGLKNLWSIKTPEQAASLLYINLIFDPKTAFNIEDHPRMQQHFNLLPDDIQSHIPIVILPVPQFDRALSAPPLKSLLSKLVAAGDEAIQASQRTGMQAALSWLVDAALSLQ